MKSGRLTNLTWLIAVGALVSGCSGGDIDIPAPSDDPERGAEAPAEQTAPPPAEEPAEASQISAVVNEIDRHGFDIAARDPFTPPPPPEGPQGVGAQIEVECDPEVEPLGLYTVQQIRLIGLVTGTPVPRAMFDVPGSPGGRAVIVGEGAKVGPRCGSRISDIRDNEVVVEQLSAIESERVETVLTLNAVRVEASIETTAP